jgi:hypothetical protein
MLERMLKNARFEDDSRYLQNDTSRCRDDYVRITQGASAARCTRAAHDGHGQCGKRLAATTVGDRNTAKDLFEVLAATGKTHLLALLT